MVCGKSKALCSAGFRTNLPYRIPAGSSGLAAVCSPFSTHGLQNLPDCERDQTHSNDQDPSLLSGINHLQYAGEPGQVNGEDEQPHHPGRAGRRREAPQPAGEQVDVPAQVQRQPGTQLEPTLAGRPVAPGRRQLGQPPAGERGLHTELDCQLKAALALDRDRLQECTPVQLEVVGRVVDRQPAEPVQRQPGEPAQRPLEERPALLPAPTTPYDVPLWAEPKVARDQHAQVAKALYSLPTRFVGHTLRARADRQTVRFYHGTLVVKVHARLAPGGRATDPTDFPVHKSAYALRDVAFLQQQATTHGEAVGQLARALLDCPLPWTRMRRVYALLRLAQKYGDHRVNAACTTALEHGLLDVRRLGRMIELGILAPEPPPARVIPLARYLRPASQYALPLAPASAHPKETA